MSVSNAMTVAGDTSIPASVYTPDVHRRSWNSARRAPIAIFHSKRKLM